jgi:hypothetical protein
VREVILLGLLPLQMLAVRRARSGAAAPRTPVA